MFLNNFWRVLNIVLSMQNGGQTSYNQNYSHVCGVDNPIVALDDTTMNYFANHVVLSGNSGSGTSSSNYIQTARLSNNYNILTSWVCHVGTSDQQNVGTETKLYEDVTSDFSLALTQQSNDNDASLEVIVTITGQNNASETIIIKELGFAKNFEFAPDANMSAKTTSYTTTTKAVLLARHVLQEPIEVEPGGHFMRTVKITMR